MFTTVISNRAIHRMPRSSVPTPSSTALTLISKRGVSPQREPPAAHRRTRSRRVDYEHRRDVRHPVALVRWCVPMMGGYTACLPQMPTLTREQRLGQLIHHARGGARIQLAGRRGPPSDWPPDSRHERGAWAGGDRAQLDGVMRPSALATPSEFVRGRHATRFDRSCCLR